MKFVIYHKETTFYIHGMKSGGYGSKGAATRALNSIVELSEKRHKAALMMEDVSYSELGWKGFKAKQREVAAMCALPERDMVNLQHPHHEVVLDKDDYAIVDAIEFAATIEKEVERINMMSGKPFKEAANTPNYCSPASEAYWSM